MLSSLISTFHQTYDRAGDIRTTLHHKMTRQVQRTQDSIEHAYQVTSQNCQQAGHYVSQKYHETADKASTFVYNNKDKIFFAGCCIATAYFAPELFLGSAVITLILRVEISHYLKKLADDYLKDEVNPYKSHPRYDNYMSSIDLMMGGIAAVDAIALGTLFVAGSWTVAVLPALGGVAAGNCAAKWAMDIIHS